MLNAVGCFLTTERGSWAVIAFTAIMCALAYWSVTVSTFALSVEAILLTQAVLARQGNKETRDETRERAS